MDNTIESSHNNPDERRDPTTVPPIYGDANPQPPQPPQSLRLSLPLYRAFVWPVLLGLIVVVYILEAVLSGGLQPTYQVTQLLGAKDNAAIFVDQQYWRFLTAMFLHGSLLHILFNGYSLYALGPTTERFFGPLRFLGLYLIAGFAGGVASYTFSSSNSVGASGAIFGLVGGLAAFFYASRATLGDLARQQLGSLATVVMINLFIGFGSGGSIDNFAHIGGMVGGAAVGWLLAPRLTLDDRLYPPVVERRFLPYGWAGAILILALLVGLVLYVIKPPL